MTNNRGVSKREWLDQGLAHLNLWGVSGVKIEKMAQSLGIARAGFYWHFKNREDLLNRLLAHWVKESTEVITANETLLTLDPKLRLIKTAEMILEHNLGEFDLAIRQWALTDKEAAKAVRKVNRLRM
jgi:AcrR family transcriptional regulator